jgi:hypothetical protein
MVIVMNEIVGISSAEFDQYRALVADIEGMTDQQKEEAILIVVNMMKAFVDAAWGVHPEQLAIENRNIRPSQNGGEGDKILLLGTAMTVDLSSRNEREGAITDNRNGDFAP